METRRFQKSKKFCHRSCVGRGSTGGDLVVGGLSVGETSTSKGVQKFLIEVQDNSKLQTINSTNNTLKSQISA